MARRLPTFAGGLVALAFVLLSGAPADLPSADAGNPYEELFGRKPKMWSDPEARFSIDLPLGWESHYKEGESFVGFTKVDRDRGLSAQVTVEMRPLPPKTRLNHFVLTVQREMEKKAPNYKLVDSDKLDVSGVPARRYLFTYQVRGNAQLTNEVVQVVLVTADKGYTITFESSLGVRARFWEEFELMVKGFTTGGAAPVENKTRSGKRKRLRAGELVNPDALKY